jgi:hypothetical protein
MRFAQNIPERSRDREGAVDIRIPERTCSMVYLLPTTPNEHQAASKGEFHLLDFMARRSSSDNGCAALRAGKTHRSLTVAAPFDVRS